MRLLPLFLLALLSPAALAQTITFESIPGVVGEAPELMPIRDQFNISPYWVRFERLENGQSLPVTLAKVGRIGGDRVAFQGPRNTTRCGETSQADMPMAGLPFDPGCFFLTDDGEVGDRAPDVQPIIIRYTVPVLQASGYILDIDGTESFEVHARDANGVDVAPKVTLTATGNDGDASFWAFQVDEPIHSIRIELAATASTKGIAFDQFSTATICPAQVTHRGNGTPGSGGLVPALSIDCPRVGQAGSIEVFNGLGGAHGCLGISLASTTRPLRCGGGTIAGEFLSGVRYLRPHFLSGQAGAPGEGRFSLDYDATAIPMAMIGTSFYIQAGYCDPGAACGIALTEIIEATIR